MMAQAAELVALGNLSLVAGTWYQAVYLLRIFNELRRNLAEGNFLSCKTSWTFRKKQPAALGCISRQFTAERSSA